MDDSRTWLLVADASKARIYSMIKARAFQRERPDILELVSEHQHLDSRKKGAQLVSDKMGEFGSGTFVEATSPKVHEAEQFAHELLRHLEVGRTAGRFRDVIIVAPPAFMGLLCKHMPHLMEKLISQRIEKDYTQYPERELMKNLMSHL